MLIKYPDHLLASKMKIESDDFSENSDVYEKLFLGNDLLFFSVVFLMLIKYPDHLLASKMKINMH